MPELRTSYLGLSLAHPIVASASPISRTIDGIRRLEDGGVSAIVLFSLFEEQLVQDARHTWEMHRPEFAEMRKYFPEDSDYEIGPEAYLELIRRAKEAVDIPIIASLNAVTDHGWTDFAGRIQEAGADALELNIFFVPADVSTSGRAVEQRYVDIVHAVRSVARLPLAVKLSPFFSAPGDIARRLIVAGADGLVLFNRFYQPDYDLDSLRVLPSLELSQRGEIRLPLLWIAVLRGRIPGSLAASTGVETPAEAIKYLLSGADAVMTTSALMRHGPAHADTLVRGLREWLERRGHRSVSEVRGMLSQIRLADPSAYERSNYVRIMQAAKAYRSE